MARFKFILARRLQNRPLLEPRNTSVNHEANPDAELGNPGTTESLEAQDDAPAVASEVNSEQLSDSLLSDNETRSETVTGSNETRPPSPVIAGTLFRNESSPQRENIDRSAEESSGEESTLPGREGDDHLDLTETVEGNPTPTDLQHSQAAREEHEPHVLPQDSASIPTLHTAHPQEQVGLDLADEHIGSTLTEEFIRRQNYCVVSELEAFPDLGQTPFTDLPEFSFGEPIARTFPTFPTDTFRSRSPPVQPEEAANSDQTGLRVPLSEDIAESAEVRTLNQPPRPFVVVQESGENIRRAVEVPLQRPRHRSISSDEEREVYDPSRPLSAMPRMPSFKEGTKTKPPEQKRKRPLPGRGRNLIRGQTRSRAGHTGALRTTRESTLPLSLSDFRILSRDIALQAVNLYVTSTKGTSAPRTEHASPPL